MLENYVTNQGCMKMKEFCWHSLTADNNCRKSLTRRWIVSMHDETWLSYRAVCHRGGMYMKATYTCSRVEDSLNCVQNVNIIMHVYRVNKAFTSCTAKVPLYSCVLNIESKHLVSSVCSDTVHPAFFRLFISQQILCYSVNVHHIPNHIQLELDMTFPAAKVGRKRASHMSIQINHTSHFMQIYLTTKC